MSIQQRFKLPVLLGAMLLMFIAGFGENSDTETEKLTAPQYWNNGEAVRTVIGFEQSGASSALSKQNFFFDIFVSTPVPFFNKKQSSVGPRFRAWGNVRVTSVPQQIKSSISEFATNFYSKVGEVKVNEVAQAVEFIAGLEYTIGELKLDPKNIFTLSVIAGAGAITPLTPKDTIEIFRISSELIEKYSTYDFTGKEYAAFVKPERDRFYRQYNIGFRLKSFISPDTEEGKKSKSAKILYRFPAMLDITIGLNDSVTGGRLGIKNTIIRIDGFIPLKLSKGVYIYLFGNALLKTTHTKISDPLILEPAPTGTTFPAGNVIQINEGELNRDYYRIGVGVDLSGLLTKVKVTKK